MSDIEWPKSAEAVIAIAKERINAHEKVIYGNGQPGVLDFIAGLKGQMRLIMALLIFLSTLAAIGSVLVAIKSLQRGALDMPVVQNEQPALADSAEIPTTINWR